MQLTIMQVVTKGDLQLEEAPAPVFSILSRLLGMSEGRECPRLPSIDRYLDADHFPAIDTLIDTLMINHIDI